MLFFILSTPEDEKTFVLIYEKYKNLIYSVSWDVFKNAESAEDNTQDVLIYIMNNFSKFAALDEKSTKGLICLATSSMAKNNLRYNSRHNLTALSYDAETIPELIDDSIFDACDSVVLASAIDNLSDDYKFPLYYYYVYGYNSKEISKILNISDALVRKRIQLAKKQLSKILEDKS